jgi:hypothetical protein
MQHSVVVRVKFEFCWQTYVCNYFLKSGFNTINPLENSKTAIANWYTNDWTWVPAYFQNLENYFVEKNLQDMNEFHATVQE